eukprot:comp18891_c1_seq1/m.21017 comp18891_c1_seq1/g.21017  ORF comp18891_c1_seq1/g.21017 comp18891_c1_seq1/m.21017 type:complete len:188 (-) comp18891_c1_seq1:105-668(-)
MNSAMGFDSLLVMRHGCQASPDADRLGCYYCNDVIAPTDSTKDRTLDQQCTVSRPGLSFLASSMVSELCISVIQHEMGVLAPANTPMDELPSTDASPLGLVPHQIRGFLSTYHFVAPVGKAYNRCTACSRTVVERYQREGFDFLLSAFNSPTYLEDLTGLTALKAETEEVDFSEEDCEFGEEIETDE